MIRALLLVFAALIPDIRLAAAAPPMRVVALEFRYVEHLLALGLVPAGMADKAAYVTHVGVGADALTAATEVGTRQEPSLEAIAALKPDLIVGVRLRHAAIEERLKAIAPTQLFDYTDLPEHGPRQLDEMRRELTVIGDAVRRPEAARAALAQLDAAAERARARVTAAGLAGQRFVFAQFLDAAPKLRLFTHHSIAVQLLEEIGLVNAWTGRFERFGYNVAGIEALPLLGDAHVLYTAYGPTQLERLAATPIWRALPFVRLGRAHALPADTWPFGGPLSAQIFLERSVAALTEPRG